MTRFLKTGKSTLDRRSENDLQWVGLKMRGGCAPGGVGLGGGALDGDKPYRWDAITRERLD